MADTSPRSSGLLAALWAEDPDYYAQRGWRPWGSEIDLVLPRELAAHLPDPIGVRLAKASDATAIHRLYEAMPHYQPFRAMAIVNANLLVDPDRLEFRPDRLLAAITDPSVALILMMIGVYGLFFEFSNPGFVLPGVVGAIALLLGLFALHMLPDDAGSVWLFSSAEGRYWSRVPGGPVVSPGTTGQPDGAFLQIGRVILDGHSIGERDDQRRDVCRVHEDTANRLSDRHQRQHGRNRHGSVVHRPEVLMGSLEHWAHDSDVYSWRR